MDKISKALKRLSPKEQKRIKELLLKIKKGDLVGLDLKKLQGRKDIFRVRRGDLRIIFQKKSKNITILAIERRSEDTYKKL
ncbi:type II toxin-antitoxin system RelE/ParE family toxin [Patescibacteria group bacterium]|nr:type II toxin-antitoxin system RelE/ParE family toxin [Patescibacteria group bacterium]